MSEGNVISVEGICRAYDTKVIGKVSERLPRGGLSKEMSNDNTTDTFEIILEDLLEGVNEPGRKFYLHNKEESCPKPHSSRVCELKLAADGTDDVVEVTLFTDVVFSEMPGPHICPSIFWERSPSHFLHQAIISRRCGRYSA